MKAVGVLLAFLGVLFLWTAPVSAQTSASGKITVRGVIAPARYVILDDNGEIKQILSNTTESVQPTVYLNSLSQENQKPLNSEVLSEYNQLLPKNAGIGELYKKDPSAPKLEAKPQNAANENKYLKIVEKFVVSYQSITVRGNYGGFADIIRTRSF